MNHRHTGPVQLVKEGRCKRVKVLLQIYNRRYLTPCGFSCNLHTRMCINYYISLNLCKFTVDDRRVGRMLKDRVKELSRWKINKCMFMCVCGFLSLSFPLLFSTPKVKRRSRRRESYFWKGVNYFKRLNVLHYRLC